MESISLLCGGSLLKLPLHASLSSTPMMASRLHFDLRKQSFPQLSNGSTRVSIGPTWYRNIDDKFLTHCGNVHAGETYSDAKDDPLKSLLSLVQARGKNSSISAIASAKVI